MLLTSASHSRFWQARNKCSATIQCQRLLLSLKRRTLTHVRHLQPDILVLCQSNLQFLPFRFPSHLYFLWWSYCEPYMKAEIFASRFVSISALPNYPTPPASTYPTVPFFLPAVSTRTICQTLHLNVFKQFGLDGIPPTVLKYVPLGWLLFYIVCSAFLSKCLPFQSLEDALWFPLSTNAVILLTKNYRPIPLTYVIWKVFETVISDHLRSFLEQEGLMSDSRYSFRPSLVISLVGFTLQSRRNTLDPARHF